MTTMIPQWRQLSMLSTWRRTPRKPACLGPGISRRWNVQFSIFKFPLSNISQPFDDKTLVGVISVGPDEDPEAQNITSLVVHPARQREGIASILLHTLIENFGADPMTVQTAAKNLPALALYAKFGFVD